MCSSDLPPGRAIEVRLSEPPAPRYLAARLSDNDRFYQALVRELSQGRAVYDPDLSNAAREFVYQATELGTQPPSDVREFLTDAMGAVAGDTTFQHARSGDDTEPALRRAIAQIVEQPPSGAGVLHIGVGEVYQPGSEPPRHIGVVGTLLDIELEPLDRRVTPGHTVQVAGLLHHPWRDLQALTLGPTGKLETLPVTVAGTRVQVAVPVGELAGSVEVQLIGEGPVGPGRLVQLRFEVGQPLPTRFASRLPPDESNLRTADDAARAIDRKSTRLNSSH